MKSLPLVVLASTLLHTITRLRRVGAFATTTMKRVRVDAEQPRTTSNAGRALHSEQWPRRTAMNEALSASADASADGGSSAAPPPLVCVEEGLLAVHKPLTWTSSDVVQYVRGILTRDAGDRGALEGDGGGRRKKRGPVMKVGHGGTLDPLASGVLVLGVGRAGTSRLESYLKGEKRYAAACELGYETDTLDAEGELVRSAPWDHVATLAAVEAAVLPKFSGRRIQQVPPMYSAIRVGGKRLYEIARKGDKAAAEQVEIPIREVEVHALEVGAQLEGSVLRSGVVDGPEYRKAAKAATEAAEEAAAVAKAQAAMEAAAVAEAAAIAATKNDGDVKDGDGADDDVKGKSDSEDQGNGGDRGNKKNKKRRRGGKRNNKNSNNDNNKKNLFNEDTVPVIRPPSDGDGAVGLELPRFALSVRCGGGMYVRSLVRDIGYELGTVATMTGLVRTKQGPFTLEDALRKEDWTADKIYEAIRQGKKKTMVD